MSTHLEKFSLAFPPPDLLRAHTQQHQKEKIKRLQRLRSAAQRQTTPEINTKHHRILRNKKITQKRDKHLCTWKSFGLHQSIRLAGKHAIATKQQ
jgi:hypothetical protein